MALSRYMSTILQYLDHSAHHVRQAPFANPQYMIMQYEAHRLFTIKLVADVPVQPGSDGLHPLGNLADISLSRTLQSNA